jgi:hypothetical protein
MKSVGILTMAVAATVLAAPGAMANSVALRVQVPFDFVVADQHLPRGEYRFVHEQAGGLVRIYSKSGGQVAVAQWAPRAMPVWGSGMLVFHKYGSRRFLTAIRTNDGGEARLPKTRSEDEARAGGSSPTTVALQ